ncbi:MAG TPA: alpha/beta fold hydrolase [Burkholderiaceae bacterium]|nr:alpha/beta fold hydrolase [Burkholderiaceae bacterium]
MGTISIDTFTAELPHGIRLVCRAAGRPGAPTLVFLHGFPEAAFAWDEVVQRLAGRYRCVAPNLRGYAGSSSPAQVEAYRPKHLVQDLVELLRQLGAPVAALVAHDWGGAVAWNLAVQQPDLIERLVIVNSPHPGTFLRELKHNPAQQQASAYMNFLCRPDAEQLLAADDYARMWPFFERMGAAGERGWLTESMRERYREVWRQGLTGPLNYYRASPLRPPTADQPGAAQVELSAEQVTVRVPTLVLWGEADLALPPSLLDGLDAYVPTLTLRRRPGATHWILHEEPDWVAQQVESFVEAPA